MSRHFSAALAATALGALLLLPTVWVGTHVVDAAGFPGCASTGYCERGVKCDVTFLAPVGRPGATPTFTSGSRVAYKVDISCGGKAIPAPPRLFFAKLDAKGRPSPETPANGKAGNLLVRDGNHWAISWDTSGLVAGSYATRVDVGDGLTHALNVSVTAKGK